MADNRLLQQDDAETGVKKEKPLTKKERIKVYADAVGERVRDSRAQISKTEKSLLDQPSHDDASTFGLSPQPKTLIGENRTEIDLSPEESKRLLRGDKDFIQKEERDLEKLPGMDELILSLDLPTPEDGVLRNTPEVRAILRSLRGQIGWVMKLDFNRMKEREQELSNKTKKKYNEKIELWRIKKTLRLFKKADKSEQDIEELNKLRGRLSMYEKRQYSQAKLIGTGGYGDVFMVVDPETGEKIVVKVLKKIDAEQFHRVMTESKVLMSLGKNDKLLKGFVLRKTGDRGVPGIPDSANKLIIETEFVDGKGLDRLSSEYSDQINALARKLLDHKSGTSNRGLSRGDFNMDFKIFRFSHTDLSEIKSFQVSNSDKKFSELSPNHELTDEDAEALILLIDKVYRLRVVDFISQCCGGLAEAHDEGIIHRDIKGANIMMDTEGRVKIIDFGLVKADASRQDLDEHIKRMKRFMEKANSNHSIQKEITDPGDVLGTPYFMSPEYCHPTKYLRPGETIITPYDDIWATGIMLAQSLTDIYPFDGNSAAGVMDSIIEYDTEGLEEIRKRLSSPILFSILKKALAQYRRNRFSSMRKFQEALEIFQSIETNSFADYIDHQSGKWAEEHNEEDGEETFQINEMTDRLFTHIKDMEQHAGELAEDRELIERIAKHVGRLIKMHGKNKLHALKHKK